jgi:hypothetical protein
MTLACDEYLARLRIEGYMFEKETRNPLRREELDLDIDAIGS